jgi:hypothetical protein
MHPFLLSKSDARVTCHVHPFLLSFFIRTNLVYANLIIYAFMLRRETQTAKTIRESFHGLLLIGGQQELCTWS